MYISEIYHNYKIPPQLQLHQLQVAGVAKIILENLDEKLEIDSDTVITACLIHDMGNIIKFDLSLYPEHLEPEGLDFWLDVQKEFIKKYGEDEHRATFKIAQEIGVPEQVLHIIANLGFSNALNIIASDNLELKIATYADQRVNFGEIVDMRQRHIKSRERYLKRRNYQNNLDKGVDEFGKLSDSWRKIENEIFGHSLIKPEEISIERVSLLISKLKEIDIT